MLPDWLGTLSGERIEKAGFKITANAEVFGALGHVKGESTCNLWSKDYYKLRLISSKILQQSRYFQENRFCVPIQHARNGRVL